ncbi:MAG: galactonate dehydratase [Planctomycetaceae bacterium]|nr:galactonate dehydratase [Planctomycetaceae bacterium]
MKITDIKTYVVGLDRNFMFVEVMTDAGISGIGEAGLTFREDAQVGFIEALKPSLIGQAANQTEHLWQTMARCGFFPTTGVGAAAISAIDIALWDIKAKSYNVPLYELLGGKVRDKIYSYTHIHGMTPESLAADAKIKYDAGWQAVRFQPAHQDGLFEPRRAIKTTVSQVAMIRETIGDDIEIILDVHTRLDPNDAISLCNQLEPYNLYFIEDPVRVENVSVVQRLREATSVPIAIGEQFSSKWEFAALIENNWLDFCRMDLCVAGGVTEAQKIAAMCESHYIPIAPHNPLGPVATAACVHMDLATSNFAVQECARPPGTILSELFPTQVSWEDGFLYPTEAAGLGIEFNPAAVRQYPPTSGDAPRLQRADGSYINW